MKKRKARKQLTDSESLFIWVRTRLDDDWEDGMIRYIRTDLLKIPADGLPETEPLPELTKAARLHVDGLIDRMEVVRAVWFEPVYRFVCYGTLPHPDPSSGPMGLAFITKTDNKSRWDSDKGRDENYAFPISIRISPRITKRQLLAFITNNWKTAIEPLRQDLTRHRLPARRTTRSNPEIQKRNNLIWKLWKSGRSYKEISLEASKKFPNQADKLDEGSIGGILNAERKRRGVRKA